MNWVDSLCINVYTVRQVSGRLRRKKIWRAVSSRMILQRACLDALIKEMEVLISTKTEPVAWKRKYRMKRICMLNAIRLYCTRWVLMAEGAWFNLVSALVYTGIIFFGVNSCRDLFIHKWSLAGCWLLLVHVSGMCCMAALLNRLLFDLFACPEYAIINMIN